MKKCIGLIINRLDDRVTLMDFLLNAKRFGHKIDEVIVIYSQDIDRGYLENVLTFAEVKLIHVNRLEDMVHQLMKRNVSEAAIHGILNMNDFEKTGLVTYSKKRNLVLLQALMDDMDVVFFIDSDVHPCILYGENTSEEIDFIGEHMAYLNFKDVAATTSDYSGYYILPPMLFEGMEDFLLGIQKEKSLPYMLESKIHNCLHFGLPSELRIPRYTDKMLGGNLAMRIKFLKEMPPFFSFYYQVNDQYYLTRGEDTTMGLFFQQYHANVVDIDVKIIHDTFGTFPKYPDLVNDKRIKDRLFFASMGWIGRNPFMNYINGDDPEKMAFEQKEHLIKGAKAIAEYLQDDRFLLLPTALDCALANLPAMIKRYELVKKSWFEITKAFERSI